MAHSALDSFLLGVAKLPAELACMPSFNPLWVAFLFGKPRLLDHQREKAKPAWQREKEETKTPRKIRRVDKTETQSEASGDMKGQKGGHARGDSESKKLKLCAGGSTAPKPMFMRPFAHLRRALSPVAISLTPHFSRLVCKGDECTGPSLWLWAKLGQLTSFEGFLSLFRLCLKRCSRLVFPFSLPFARFLLLTLPTFVAQFPALFSAPLGYASFQRFSRDPLPFYFLFSAF